MGRVNLGAGVVLFLFLISGVLPAWGGVTPTMAIEEAKFAIDQARKAGAEQKAGDDLAASKSWLVRAEKEYAEARSFTAKMSTAKTKKAREEEIIFLAVMAKVKALTAEAKAKKDTLAAELKDARKDLVDFQGALEVLKKNVAETAKAREVQAKAEVERKQLEEAKRQAEEQEAQKRMELAEAQRKAAERHALKEKELQEARIKEAERSVQREKELAEAKMQAEKLYAQRAREEMEMKAKEEKLAAERQKMAALQAKAEALEREKALLAEASKIPQVTVKAGEEMVITVLVINLFGPGNELKPAGKTILDGVGSFLKSCPKRKVVVRGHTDSQGKPATNQAVAEKRAQKVREYLVSYQNIDPTRVKAEGLGPAQPVATNATEAGRTLNRRVEVAVLPEE